MTSGTHDDVYALTEQLAEKCQDAGLHAKVVAPTHVHVSAPGAHARLAETVRCMPDPQQRLMWWWSWEEPIGPADQIAEAVKLIAHVVAPPAAGARSPLP
jgi:hypothetical protein